MDQQQKRQDDNFVHITEFLNGVKWSYVWSKKQIGRGGTWILYKLFQMSFEWIALNRHIVNQQPEAFSSHLVAAVGDVRLEKFVLLDFRFSFFYFLSIFLILNVIFYCIIDRCS